MAVPLSPVYYSGVGTGALATYGTGVYAQISAQIVVKVDDVVQTIGDDYTLDNLRDDNGVDVIANFPVGTAVLVERITALTQEVDTQNNETVLEDVLDAEFDKLTMIAQEAEARLTRSFLVARGETAPAVDTPVANRVPAFIDGRIQWVANGAADFEEDVTEALAEVEAERVLAQQARTGAQTAQGLSEDARDASITAQGLSEDARDASITAQGGSEDARDLSQAYAAAAEALLAGHLFPYGTATTPLPAGVLAVVAEGDPFLIQGIGSGPEVAKLWRRGTTGGGNANNGVNQNISIPSLAAIQPILDAAPVHYPVLLVGFNYIEYVIDDAGVARVISDIGINGVRSYASPQDPTLLRTSILYATLGLAGVYEAPASYPWAIVLLDSAGVLRLEATVTNAGAVLHYQDNFSADLLLAETIAPLYTPYSFVLFTIAGQSNAIGRGGVNNRQTIPAGVAYVWNPDTATLDALLADPLPPAVLGAQGSAWPAFANEFFKRTGKGVIFVQTAWSGSSQTAEAENPDGSKGTWDDHTLYGGTLHRTVSVTRTKAARAYLDANMPNYSYGGILWMQGEGDAGYILAPGTAGYAARRAKYIASFQGMMTYFRTQYGYQSASEGAVVPATTPIYICMTRSSELEPGLAQNVLCERDPYAIMAYTGTPTFVGRGLMLVDGTGVHYDTFAQNEAGRFMARAAASNRH